MTMPETWREVLLPQVADLVGGGTPERSNNSYFGGGVPWITPSDVTKLNGFWIYSTQETLTEDGLRNSPAKLVPKGTVVMATRVAVGRAAIAGVDLATNQDFTSLVVDSNLIDSEYLARAIDSFAGLLESRAQGSTIKGLPRATIERLKIPLPTLPEQQRIAEMLRQVEAVSELRRQVGDLLLQTKRQLFVEMFGDPNPRINTRWPDVKLGSVVKVATGGTPPREQTDSYGGQVSWVKSTDLKDESILITEERLSHLGIQRSNAKVYPQETVLLAMYGQGQTRGRTGKLLIEAACNQACAALLPSDVLLPDYLWVWFQLSYESVRSLGRGGQQENLNLDIVRNISVPRPPRKLQEEFSLRLTALLETVNKSRVALRKHDELLSVLRAEVMRGKATAVWREMHAAEITEAAKARDVLLRERGAKFITSARARVTASTTARTDGTPRPTRYWLLRELSEFQREVLAAFIAYCARTGQPLLAEDAEVFAGFCDDAEVAERLHAFGPSLINRIRRTLSQLAALGMIAKLTLPKRNLDTGEREYLKAFRPLREAEFTRLADVGELRKVLGADDAVHDRGLV